MILNGSTLPRGELAKFLPNPRAVATFDDIQNDVADMGDGVTNSSFLTLGPEASLGAERVLTLSNQFSGVDGGANSSFTLGLADRVPIGTNKFTFDTGIQIGGAATAYGTYGTMLRPDGARDWITLMPRPDAESVVDAVEYALNGGIPLTYTAVGSNVTFTSGAIPASAVNGRIILEEGVYPIVSVGAGGTTCVVTGTPAASGVGVYAPTKGTGTCSISGTTVTRLSGDPFIGFTSSPFRLEINGTLYTVTDSSGAPDTYVVSVAPGDTSSATYVWRTTINDQIATLRVARLWGSNEENVSLYARYDGYWLHSLYGGSGTYRPLVIGSGEITAGTLAQQIVCQKNGDLTLGWTYTGEAIRILNQAGAVNRLETQAALTGATPSWRARGTDTNVGLNLDTQGTGAFTFTSGAFGRTNFKVFGSNGADYLTVDAATGSVPIAAAGSSTNIDLQLMPKGSGVTRFGSQANYPGVFDAGTGNAPGFRARGSDTNVGMGYDTQGTGAHTFTSGSFGRTNFKIFGTNAVDYLTVDAGAGSVPVAAAGGSTNIDIRLLPKGTGAVRLGTSVRFGTWTSNADAPVNGYITIVDDAGTTRKLATIA